MKIYSMTATFGKLEHETLTLESGLNLLEAPNEWGKTTWCAFLCAMFYGLDTRGKSTKTALADKERYAPWSGSPMSGRMDLNWKGRDVTIERTTRGRVPMGAFRAYETKTGLEIPELTAANCGLILLGVEQSAFRRSAFIRQSDMPISGDEALRRRLNDLVTSGDESGEADRLEKELREIRNRCRYNRTGLIPQAEARKQELESKLEELQTLESHSRHLKLRLGELKGYLRQLENHQAALRYAAAMSDAARVAEALELRDLAERNMLAAEEICRDLPTQQEAEEKVRQLRAFAEEWNAVRMHEILPELPVPPAMPQPFAGMGEQDAVQMEASDRKRYAQLKKKRSHRVLMVLGFVLMLAAAAACLGKYWPAAGAVGLAAWILLGIGIRKRGSIRREMEALAEKYGTADPAGWILPLKQYRREREAYEQALAIRLNMQTETDHRRAEWEEKRQALERWQDVLQKWQQRNNAARELQQARRHLEILRSVAKVVPPPAMEDTLLYSTEETQQQITQSLQEQQRLQNRLGQYQGRMEALGDRDAITASIQALTQKLAKLEQTYHAAVLGLETLELARQELQRRFAPRISQRAQELMGAMTDGRYDRLRLDSDLSLLAGTNGDEILRDTLWRSEGTADQLYVALRLAVAEELIPNVPLVLDDAFVRFDDTRLTAALKLILQQAESRQVILFTCQSREKTVLWDLTVKTE